MGTADLLFSLPFLLLFMEDTQLYGVNFEMVFYRVEYWISFSSFQVILISLNWLGLCVFSNLRGMPRRMMLRSSFDYSVSSDILIKHVIPGVAAFVFLSQTNQVREIHDSAEYECMYIAQTSMAVWRSYAKIGSFKIVAFFHLTHQVGSLLKDKYFWFLFSFSTWSKIRQDFSPKLDFNRCYLCKTAAESWPFVVPDGV